MKTSVTLALAFAVGACSKSESNEGKLLPQLAPPQAPLLPASLVIEVVVDGQPHAPVTQATLAHVTPDWSDTRRRAWSLARLVGIDATPNTTFAVTGTRGITVEFPSDQRLVPALLLSRRGTVVAELLDPAEPFPAFHGAGGRLGRSPEPTPRMPGVMKIEVRHR
jgi:hypothetical protein